MVRLFLVEIDLSSAFFAVCGKICPAILALLARISCLVLLTACGEWEEIPRLRATLRVSKELTSPFLGLGPCVAADLRGTKCSKAKCQCSTRMESRMLSVNTNYGAAVALQNLNTTSKALERSQNAINTGLKISSAKDNGAIFAVAQGMRADVAGYKSVTDSLNRATSVTDTAIAAGQAISDLLTEMKEKALASNDASIDANARASYQADFDALKSQITKIVDNAAFDGTNLVNGSTTKITALANITAGNVLTVAAQSLKISGSVLTLKTTSSISTQAKASAMIATLNTSIDAVNLSLAKLGTAAKKLDIHKTFVGKLSDELEKGIGNLVDADLAKESALLQSLQTKQQLGIQALSIANQAPSAVLSLFR
jgi:flagellin